MRSLTSGNFIETDIADVFFRIRVEKDGLPRLMYIGPGIGAFCGVQPDLLINDPFLLFDSFDHAQWGSLWRCIQQAGHGCEICEWEGMFRKADEGVLLWLNWKGRVTKENNGSTSFSGIVSDITLAKKQQINREKENGLLQKACEMAKVGFWEVDLQSMQIVWSEEVYRIHELEPGTHHHVEAALSYYPPGAKEKISEVLEQVKKNGQSYDIVLPFITAKGNFRWVRTSGNPLFENGKAVKLYGFFQDITDQKKTEEQLDLLFEYSTEPHLLFDDTGILACNRAAITMLACKDKNELLRHHPAYFSPEFQPDGRSSAVKSVEMDRLARKNGWHRFEWIHRRMDGRYFPVEVTLNPVTTQGKPMLLAVWHDISERKLAEEKLKASEARLSETQELTRSGSWEADLITGKNYWSAETYRIFELEPMEEGPDVAVFEPLIHPDDRHKYKDAVRESLVSGKFSDFELRLLCKSGKLKYIQTIGKPFFSSGGKVTKLYGAIVDITELKLKEETILQKKSLLRNFLDNTPAAIAILDTDMRYIITSKFWKIAYQLKGDIIGRSHYDVLPYLPERWKELHQRCLAGEVIQCEEDSFTDPDGHTQWLKWEIRPWYEKDNTISGIIMRTEVITEQILAKNSLLRAKEQAEHAAMVNAQFLSTMSHEIRTPLNAVMGFTQLLLQDPREDQREYLNILQFSTENLLVLINDILDFNKIEEGKIDFESVDLNLGELIGNVRSALLQKAEEKGIVLKLMLDGDLPETLIGDPVRIGQIITNLLSNAVKFTEKGKVVLSASLVKIEQEMATVHIEVKDTGIGIPQEKQECIFERFMQGSSDTTRKYGGTGLGLTITRRLLQLMGSEIKLESEPGHGSVFSFELQLKINKTARNISTVDTSNKEVKNLRGLRLLLVEDNSVNVLLANKFFKKWEVEFDVAQNGREAIDMIQASRYDLVLMDLQMPEMDGYEATAHIRQLSDPYLQKIPIIALTASAMLEIKDRAFIVGMNDYISKPFNPGELYKKIETCYKNRPLVNN